MITIKKIRDLFPFPTIETIVGQPSYQTIHKMHRKLNTNTASMHTDLEGGVHSFLALTVLSQVYNTLSSTPFIALVSIGPALVILPNSTAT